MYVKTDLFTEKGVKSIFNIDVKIKIRNLREMLFHKNLKCLIIQSLSKPLISRLQVTSRLDIINHRLSQMLKYVITVEFIVLHHK